MRAIALLLLSSWLVLGAAATAHAASTTQVIQGDVLRLESVQDAAAMASMDLGQPVAWDVGVSAARDDGSIAVDLTVTATPDAYAATVRSCAAPWSAGECAGGATMLLDEPLVDGTLELGAQAATDVRWYRIEVVLLRRVGGATADIEFRASGAGETVESDGGVTLPRTGAGAVPALGLAISAIGAGIVVAAIARRSREEVTS